MRWSTLGRASIPGSKQREASKSGGVAEHIPSIEEEDQPSQDGQEGQEELPRHGHEQREHHQGGGAGLHQGPGSLADGEREDADHDQEEVLGIVDGPPVCAEGADGVGGVERGLDVSDGRGGRLGGAKLGAETTSVAARDGIGEGGPRERHLGEGRRGISPEVGDGFSHDGRWAMGDENESTARGSRCYELYMKPDG